MKPKAMAKSCVACRASKTKCSMPDDGSECVRCSRLQLKCVFEESRRGRPCAKRDQARLGPAVRALLRSTIESGCNREHIGAEMEKTQEMNDELLCWCGDECQRKMVVSIENPAGKLALLRHWLFIGVRSGSCGLLGNILLLAHSCKVPLEAFSFTCARPLPPPIQVMVPPYIAEWLGDGQRLCCARGQVEGEVVWHPSARFVSEVGDEVTLLQRLEAKQPGITERVDFLICRAEIFLAVALHEADQMCLARLVGLLWSAVAQPGALTPDGWQCAEAVAPVMVRCTLRNSPPQGDGDFTLCTLSGRSAILPDSRAVFSVLSLTPAPAATAIPTVSAVPITPGIGMEAWPMPTELMSALAGAANYNPTYEFLDDLGLTLEPEDAPRMAQQGVALQGPSE